MLLLSSIPCVAPAVCLLGERAFGEPKALPSRRMLTIAVFGQAASGSSTPSRTLSDELMGLLTSNWKKNVGVDDDDSIFDWGTPHRIENGDYATPAKCKRQDYKWYCQLSSEGHVMSGCGCPPPHDMLALQITMSACQGSNVGP